MALDPIYSIQYLDKDLLEHELNFKFKNPCFLITYHPLTINNEKSIYEIDELLKSLEKFKANLLFTMPNADPGNKDITKKIKKFVKNNKDAILVESLGQQKFLSCLKFVDGVIGNSSSGLLEVPHYNIGTVNIGNRQRGREKASSVIDVKGKESEIVSAIETIQSKEFKDSIRHQKNPYGEPGASKKIVDIIKDFFEQNQEEVSLAKRFIDLY
jgi:GDP/UDP-N,N'-diacetylbacillosamine 2-epimerase (hydrolysing)